MKRILNIRNSRIMRLFIYSHILAYLSLSIIPAKAIEPNLSFLVLLNALFISLVLFFAIIVYLGYPKQHKNVNKNPMTIKQLNINIKIVSYGSVIGFFLILYDRVFIRGINYSLGLRHARYQWLNSAGGSIPSVVGNLLVPFGYLCIYFLVLHYKRLSLKNKFLLVTSSIVSVFGHAALNGGRSNILLAVVLVIITFALKSDYRNRMFSIKLQSIKKLPIIALAVIYVCIITLSSAALGNTTMKTLTYLGVSSLYGQVYGYFDSIGEISDYLYLIVYSIAYLYHGQWTAQVAYSLPIREGNNTFFSFGVILDKLGIISEPFTQGYFAKTGAFISLPGAFYYDFGFLGVIILSALLGMLFGITLILINYSKLIGGIKLAFIFFVLFIVILSPILPAYGFMYLNFIIFSFVSLEVINRLIFRKKTNWLEAVSE